MSFDDNVSATNFTQYNDVLDLILSAPQYKAPNVTSADDVEFTKGSTDIEFFYEIPELDTRKFYNYNGFSTYPYVGTFHPKYIYAATHQLIYISSSISAIIHAAYNIASLV